MKNILILLIVSLTLLGCKDKPTTLTVNFKAVYDGAPLLLDEITTYNYFDGSPIKMTGFRFYVSDVKLYAGAEVVQIIDIEDIDFTSNNKTSTGATEGQSIVITDPVSGNYDKIEFSIGVPAADNASLPASFGYDHPLGPSNQSEYWDSWNSYIFAKIEGRQDADSNGEFVGFTYHTGVDDMFRTRAISTNFEVAEGKENTLQFEVDAKKIFANSQSTIDLVNDPVVHTLPSNTSSMIFSSTISDNLINSISIR